jgi:hypothetical protein
MNKKLKEYQEDLKIRWDHIIDLRSVAKKHPNFNDYEATVDSMYDDYEFGTIISISPTREGFDELHENYTDLYRGGLVEIKCGNDYVIYGFEFD